MEKINSELKRFMDTPPLVEYVEPMTQPNAEMLGALADCYASKGWRTYMVNAINQQTRAAVTKATTEVEMAFSKARILTLKELLIVARKAYYEKERITALAKKELEKESKS